MIYRSKIANFSFFLLLQFNIVAFSLQQNQNIPLLLVSLKHIPPYILKTSSDNKNLADYALIIYMVGSYLESKSYSATNDLIQMKGAVHNSWLNI